MRTDLLMLAPIAASIGLYGLTMAAYFGARRRRADEPLASAPRVSILKPYAGLDDELAENLESFARLEYPSWQLLLGVASIDDPALPVLRAFVDAHPELDARVVVTDPDAALNPKVAQLVGLAQASSGTIYVVSDSNVRVKPDYLLGLVGALARPGVGLVTSVIAGTGEESIGAALENLQLGAFVAPSIVAAARLMPHRPLAIGKSMAMRRRDLARLGGFASVGHVLAEDYLLGKRFRDAGQLVRVFLEPVENRNVAGSIRRTFERHSRWTKMRRASTPVGFAFELLLNPLIVTSLAFATAPTRALALALAAVAVAQMAFAQLALRATRGVALPWTWAPLELVRSAMVLACWLRAATSRSVLWRGHPFRLGAETSLTPMRPRSRTATASARA